MKYDLVDGELYERVCDVNLVITDFIMLNKNKSNKGVKKGVKYLERAQKIFDEITRNEGSFCPMYGALETIFSKKDEAEEKLKEETMVKLLNKKLLATQWKEIVKQILYEFPESRATIERLISE